MTSYTHEKLEGKKKKQEVGSQGRKDEGPGEKY